MSDYSPAFGRTHDGAGPVTCATCGCRLDPMTGREDGLYRHYSAGIAGQDARGCRPGCIDALHDRHGRAVLDAAAA